MSTARPKLYGYWRSSASWRVRWAFELKGVAFDYAPVNILKGEHREAPHLARNPLGHLPVLEWDGRNLCESLAMIDLIEARHPVPRLFPSDPWERAKALELVEIINSGTAPLQTPKVQKRHSADATEQAAWAREFISAGLAAFAALRPNPRAAFAAGDSLTVADLFVVPQIYNALRYKIDVDGQWPDLGRIYRACLASEACAKASPERQADAPAATP